MALASTALCEINTSATAGNVNGAFFNPGNANMATDLAADAGTGNTNSPVVSSASYNFVAGDINNWLFLKAGANTVPGWYKIASVASNKATLTASIGTAVQINTAYGTPNPGYIANTVAGIATVGTPTGMTWSVDYSQVTAANNSTTNDLASTSGTTNPSVVTSATYTFGVNTVGNTVHITAGTNATASWYEVVSVSGGAATMDAAIGTAAVLSALTWRIGGASSCNSTLDAAMFNKATTGGGSGTRYFFKSGNITFGQSVAATANGTTQMTIDWEGYSSIRGDAPTGSNRPVVTAGTLQIAPGQYTDLYNIIFTGTSASAFSGNIGNKFYNCKFINTSTTAGRPAFIVNGSSEYLFNCEFNSYRGPGLSCANFTAQIVGCYSHDSDVGFLFTGTSAIALFAENCIVASNITQAVNINAALAAGTVTINGCTLYGAENKQGVGLNVITGASSVRLANNIIYGFTTGATSVDAQNTMPDIYNDYFNNTADVGGTWHKGMGTIGVNPQFASMLQFTGSSATSSTNVLTDGSANFSFVTDGVDFLNITAGTGTGLVTGKYLITSHTTTTLTVSSNITSAGSGSAITYEVTYGHNFGVGTNLSGTGFPGTYPGTNTTSSTYIGAWQGSAAQAQNVSGGFV